MKTVLITGGAGFIGSHFIPFFLENNKNSNVVNLDLSKLLRENTNPEGEIVYAYYVYDPKDMVLLSLMNIKSNIC